jgi:hypothetical protein
MKTISTAFAFALAVCGAASAADSVNVHFSAPVLIGEKLLPAGDARINVLRGSNSVILTVRSEAGSSAAVVVNRITEQADEQGRATVVLGRQGKDLRLERVWLDDGNGFAVLPDAQ